MKQARGCVLLFLGVVLFSGTAFGQLKFQTDYTTSDDVYQVTNVRIDSNMTDYYLEGIQQTWAAANEVAKKLGHLEDYSIYSSMLPESGDFNLTLVVHFKDLAQYDLGRKQFQEFEKAWLSVMPEEKQREIVNDYPSMRTLVGEYLMREVTFK